MNNQINKEPITTTGELVKILSLFIDETDITPVNLVYYAPLKNESARIEIRLGGSK